MYYVLAGYVALPPSGLRCAVCLAICPAARWDKCDLQTPAMKPIYVQRNVRVYVRSERVSSTICVPSEQNGCLFSDMITARTRIGCTRLKLMRLSVQTEYVCETSSDRDRRIPTFNVIKWSFAKRLLTEKLKISKIINFNKQHKKRRKINKRKRCTCDSSGGSSVILTVYL